MVESDLRSRMLHIISIRSELNKVAVPVNPTLRDSDYDEALAIMKNKGFIIHLDRCYLPHLDGKNAELLWDVYQITASGLLWSQRHKM